MLPEQSGARLTLGVRPGHSDSPVDLWLPTQDPPSLFSSGVPELDKLLGGGFGRGTYHTFECDLSVGASDFRLLVLPVVLNFLLQGRGTMAVLPFGELPERFRDRVCRFVPARVFDSRVRIPDYIATEVDSQYRLPMARFGRDEAMREMLSAENAVAGSNRGPYLELSAADTFELLMGCDVASRMYFQVVERTKRSHNLGLTFGRVGSPTLRNLASLSDSHYQLTRVRGQLIIRGVRPWFTSMAIVADSSGNPRYRLQALPSSNQD